MHDESNRHLERPGLVRDAFLFGPNTAACFVEPGSAKSVVLSARPAFAAVAT
jgi:hypothetical protein